MLSDLKLSLTASDHLLLRNHLFPGDGFEAVSILICGRTGSRHERLCVSEIILIPHETCTIRTAVRVDWSGDYLEQAIDAADRIGGSIILIHSHPGGFFGFSDLDDESDAVSIPSLRFGSANESIPHGSAIMIPSGEIKARLYDHSGNPHPIRHILSIGEDIKQLDEPSAPPVLPFSSQMTCDLNGKSACVIGASGTGSVVIENLCRRGIGKIVLIDFDLIEHKNLNRILNSTIQDAEAARFKTKMLQEVIRKYRCDIEIITVETSVQSEKAIVAASGCDVLFSCVDTMEARYYCELMCRTFVQPLIDVGVTIPTAQREKEAVRILDVCGRVDYVHPDGPSLSDRGVVTPEGLHAEYLLRVDPEAFVRNIEEGYIRGIPEEAPSVVTLNMIGAALAVEEWIARCYPYRHEGNGEHDRVFFSLAGREFEYEKVDYNSAEGEALSKGQGLIYPLLGLVRTENSDRAAA